MFALLSDLKLWSLENDVNTDRRDTDVGTFRYHEKRLESIHDEGKKSYFQERGILYTRQNKKGNKLKEKLKYLEDQLRDHSIVYCQWHSQCIIQLVFNTGLLVYLQINSSTGDIDKISFDKFLLGKIPDSLSDAVMTANHLICTQNDNQILAVHFMKPKRQVFDKISKLEPKLLTIDLSSSVGRRIEKKIRVNRTGDLILIWWKSTTNEVYPWSPAMKEHDRANVHLYRLQGIKLDLLCYLRTEFDPLCITFNPHQDNVIHSIEQKVSRKGEVTIEWQTYGVSQQDKLQRIEVISIPLPTHTTCAKFSPNQDMLLLCCIDGSIILHDHTKRINNSIKAGFIPTLASWHDDGLIFTIGNDRGQSQHYDISLSCIKSQMLNDDTMPVNILDLSPYFRNQPNCTKISWNKKFVDSSNGQDRDALLLLLFERGPIGALRIVEGNNMPGDVLLHRYLTLTLADRAASLLLSMNWDTQPRVCMYALNQILNYLFKLPLTPERENLIQNSLGSFYVPAQAISQAVEDEYGDEIRDLTRRFFYHLIRHRLFEKAFRLAIDLNDHDLFMDLHFYALVINDVKMASAAEEKAQLVLSRSSSCSSSHSTCSRPSCSLCSNSASDNDSESYSEESESEGSRHQKTRYKFTRSSHNYRRHPNHQIPPLPVLDSPSIPKLLTTSFTSNTNYTLSAIPSKMTYSEPTAFMNVSKDVSSELGNLSIGHLRQERSYRRVNDLKLHEDTGNLSKSSDRLGKFEELTESHSAVKYSFANPNNKSNSLSNLTSDSDTIRIMVDSKRLGTRNDQLANDLSISVMDMRAFKSTSFNTDDNLMSTSFNEDVSSESLEMPQKYEDLDTSTSRESTIEVPPPPPEMTSSLANYLSNLPKKSLPLSSSQRNIGMLSKFPAHIKRGPSQILQTQSSVSAILQNQCTSFAINRPCKFNYEHECRQFSSVQCKTVMDNGKFMKSSIFQGSKGSNTIIESLIPTNVPPLPVINHSSSTKSSYEGHGSESVTSFNEKPKVKFSNTVTHILVPGMDQFCGPVQKQKATQMQSCLKSEDYGKDIQPLSKNEDSKSEGLRAEETSSIKVVHFGLL